MNESDEMPPEVRDEYRLILSEQGLPEAVRYLTRRYPASGNYTEDRRAWLGVVTLEDIFAEARRLVPSADRAPPPSRPTSTP